MSTRVVAPLPDTGTPHINHEVQHLFETRTIEDIRKIESLTRKEVEDKRQELRKLIGARYRDLIESADSILIMQQNADQLFSRITSMRGDLRQNADGLADLAQNLWAPKVNDSHTESGKAKRAKLFTAATKIKVLLETPEQIWTALEREKHLEATLLYRQAQVLHAVLRGDTASAQALAAMPVAPRQWALVCQFPAKIDAASKAFLARPDQSPEQYASALCALAILEKPAPSQIFSEFLASRTQLLVVQPPTTQSRDKDAIVQRLRNCVFAVTSTFLLVFYIFSCPTSQTNPKNPKLLAPHKDSAHAPRTKHSHQHGTHLHAVIPPTPPYFYSILQTIKDELDAIYKIHSIEHTEHGDAGSAAFFALHIPPASIHTQCGQWLSHSAQRIHALARELLAHIDGAQVLAHVRESVRAGLDEVTGTKDVSWTNVCQLVLGNEVDLWEVLCADAFATRAREIVAHSFQTVDFEGALAVLVRAPSAGVGAGLWDSEGRDDKDIAAIQNKAAGLTPNVHEFVCRFDGMLATCLADVAHLTRPAPTTPRSPAFSPRPPRITSQPPAKPAQTVSQATQVAAAHAASAAAAALEAYVQDRCFAGVSSFLRTMGKRLEVLQATILTTTPTLDPTATTHTTPSPIVTTDAEANKCADEALLIAQAARALASYSKQLAAALVPTPTQPTPAQTPPSTPTHPRKSKTDKGEEGPSNMRLNIIKKTLRQCYLRGYVLWARWITATHAQWLAACVRRDTWSDTTRRQGWEEHKVMIEGDDGAPVEERLYLPYQPSPYVLEFLFMVCREIHRAGGHTVHRTALEFLARELAHAVLDLYSAVASTHHGGGASKEGGVQLLCDACFLIDVLSVPDTAMQSDEDLRGVVVTMPRAAYHAPTDPTTEAEAATQQLGGTEGRLAQAMAWGRRVDHTVGELKDLLDPIDLAFYEPHVKLFVERCYQRSAVVFGALVQLHRPQDSRAKVPPISDPNIIPLAKPTARFGYLPISVPTPTASHHHSIATPSKHHATLGGTGGEDRSKEGAKKLSFMEQGVGSLKKFTSLNMLSSTFTTSPTSSPPSAHTPTSSTAPPGGTLGTTPKIPGLWFL